MVSKDLGVRIRGNWGFKALEIRAWNLGYGIGLWKLGFGGLGI